MRQGLWLIFSILFLLAPTANGANVYHSLFEQGLTTSSFSTGKTDSNHLRALIQVGMGADIAEEYRLNFRIGYSPVFMGDINGNDLSANDYLFTFDASYLMPRQERLMYVGGLVRSVLSDTDIDFAGSLVGTDRDWSPDIGVLAGVEHSLIPEAAVGIKAEVFVWRGIALQLSSYLLYRF